MEKHPAYTILRLLETPGIGVVKTNTILAEMGADLDSDRLQPFLSAKQYEEFVGSEEKVRQDWERLAQMEVTFISILEDRYPPLLRDRLLKKAPPLLMVLGNPDLLKKVSVGFCGSRKASEKGLTTATDCADQLARENINIVSGYAAGVDMATHRAALECGGTTTLVLCEGILHFKIKRDLKDLWDWDRIAVVSEFLPGVPWRVGNAMQRNKTICALTSSMILIESSSKGGSIEAGRACLKMGIPLFAPVYQGMPETAVGNRELLRQGALELYKNNATNRANMREVFNMIANKGKTPQPAIYKSKPYRIEGSEGQQGLFDKKEEYKTG
ncbi:MAG: DNA-protecting protein DprA [Desulfobacterales bacterium]|nr:DNA-protecting protein DprA [Desulfobacterales bacterium]